MPFVIEPMQPADVPKVVEIERECFSLPWPINAYKRELSDNKMARYIVVRYRSPGEPVVALDPHTDPRMTNREKGGRFFSIFRRIVGDEAQAADEETPPILGYAGLWLMADEAHVTTIAVRPSHQRRGLGELALVSLIDIAILLGAATVTLEVRLSNLTAQNLYLKYGFALVGVRRRYYSDNGEDARIMTLYELRSAATEQRLARLRDPLHAKLAAQEQAMLAAQRWAGS